MFLPIYFFFPPTRDQRSFLDPIVELREHRIARGDHALINVLFPMRMEIVLEIRFARCSMLTSQTKERWFDSGIYAWIGGMVLWLPAKTTNNREGERCFDSLWRYALTPLCRASTTRVSIYLQRLGRHWTGRGGNDCLRFERQTKHWAYSALEGTNE